jgi:hypothetical protein
MSAGLRALLARAIDYAGLFPPARLSLDQAIRNYAHLCTIPESCMLARFVCPATRLREVAPYRSELFESGPVLVVAVVAGGGNDAAAFLAALRADLDAIAGFRQRFGQRAVIEVLEARIPEELLSTPESDRLVNLLADAGDLLEAHGPPGLMPYYEAPPGAVSAAVGALAQGARSSRTRRIARPAGFKLRCGGLEATAFPSPQEIVSVIQTCRHAGTPLKFTAGLHHPIRHFDAGVQAHMHGFLNVLVAGVLAHARHLCEDEIGGIVADENAADFVFDDEGLRWKDRRATCAEIAAARQRAVTSFGSCSFDEPRHDLRALGLLL